MPDLPQAGRERQLLLFAGLFQEELGMNHSAPHLVEWPCQVLVANSAKHLSKNLESDIDSMIEQP